MASSDTTFEILDFVVTKSNGVQGLVSQTNLTSVPAPYIQPPQERPPSFLVSQQTIPIIDISDPSDPAVAESICDAARRFGFFQIVNHGVSDEVCNGIREKGKRFFEETTAEEKKGYDGKNAVRFGTSFSPNAETVLEWRDFVSLRFVNDKVAAERWPAACRDQALEYYKKTEAIIKNIANILMKGLNAKGIEEELSSIVRGVSVVLNYYPICPNPELTAGVGRHSDVSALTILLQDDVGGLYVRAPEGDAWIHVPPMKGALVINIGDALQIISNGHYKSIEHRVITSPSENRISVAIFAAPTPDETIGPLPEVLEGGDSPVYRQILYADYCKHYFGRGLDGKKAIDWAKA